jgi:hypothetical protein
MRTVEPGSAGTPTGMLMEGRAAAAAAARGPWRLADLDWRTAFKFLAPAALMVALLWSGGIYQLEPQYSLGRDVSRYQCFATAFWFGTDAGRTLPGQCDRVHATLAQDRTDLQNAALPSFLKDWMLGHSATSGRFHTLPIEYPILSLIPFSLPLLAPASKYPLAFGLEMTLVALALYALMSWVKGWKFGAFLCLLIGVGGYGTGIARFDLIPAGLTLLALVFAERRKWTAAYLLIGAAILLKFYPVLLLIPLLIFHWRSLPAGGRLRGIARPLGIFVAVMAGLLALSLAINPMIAYFQVASLQARPPEVESVGATLIYLGRSFGIPFQQVASFGSDNLVSVLDDPVNILMTVVMVVGLVIITVRIWRGHYSLRHAFLGILLLTLMTGKLFSTQYLLWVLPIAVYVVESLEGFMPLLWLTICALTSLEYPGLFHRPEQGYYRVVAIRNACLAALTLVAIFPELWPRSSRGQDAATEQPVPDKQEGALHSSPAYPTPRLAMDSAQPADGSSLT